jgi:hypothetical protein
MLITRKQILTISILTVMVVAGIAAVKPPKGPFKNLKILPQDISEAKLDSIMHSYNKALGEGCKFCHAPVANFPDSLDYASDALPMKNNAREMMRMNIYINQTYFNYPKGEKPEYLNTVHCMTCHRGEAMPSEHEIKH